MCVDVIWEGEIKLDITMCNILSYNFLTASLSLIDGLSLCAFCLIIDEWSATRLCYNWWIFHITYIIGDTYMLHTSSVGGHQLYQIIDLKNIADRLLIIFIISSFWFGRSLKNCLRNCSLQEAINSWFLPDTEPQLYVSIDTSHTTQ